MREKVLRAISVAGTLAEARVLAALELGAISFSDVRRATGLSRSRTSDGLRLAVAHGYATKQQYGYALRPEGFADSGGEVIHNSSTDDAEMSYFRGPDMGPGTKSEPPWIHGGGSMDPRPEFERRHGEDPHHQDPHGPDLVLDDELEAIYEQLLRVIPAFDPRPHPSQRAFIAYWEDRRHIMRAGLQYLADPLTSREIRNPSGIFRYWVTNNRSPLIPMRIAREKAERNAHKQREDPFSYPRKEGRY